MTPTMEKILFNIVCQSSFPVKINGNDAVLSFNEITAGGLVFKRENCGDKNHRQLSEFKREYIIPIKRSK